MEEKKNLVSLMDALKEVSLNSVEEIVKAEDLFELEGGAKIDWDRIFFEPEIGKSYIVKFLPNLDSENAQNIVHRTIYKLPDPQNKGKLFNFTSSGKRGCPVRELFFELYDLKKNGDIIAEEKIRNFLTSKRQACCKVQILSSPNKEEVGMIKLFRFGTIGDNATIANLINTKLNPDKEVLKIDPDSRENVFNIFSSSVLNIVCKEASYDGQKGRSFAASSWLKTKRGAFIVVNDKTHEFSPADLDEKGEFKKEVLPFVEKILEQITSPDISIYRWFEYKEVGDPRNGQELDDVLKRNAEKVNEIIPVIRDSSLVDIANYGKRGQDTKTESAAKDVLKESIPDELQNLVQGEKPEVVPDQANTDDEIDQLLKK
jgi:hypothetical protein